MEIKYFRKNIIKCLKCGDILEFIHLDRHRNRYGKLYYCSCKRVAIDPSPFLYRVLGHDENYQDLSEEWNDLKE